MSNNKRKKTDIRICGLGNDGKPFSTVITIKASRPNKIAQAIFDKATVYLGYDPRECKTFYWGEGTTDATANEIAIHEMMKDAEQALTDKYGPKGSETREAYEKESREHMDKMKGSTSGSHLRKV